MNGYARWLAAWLCCGFATAACAAPPAGIEVVGSTTMAPLVSALAKRFEALHPGTSVVVKPGGSARGIDDARRGMADVGMVSRTLTDAEKDLTGFPIARDGVAFVVNKDNPVARLKSAELRDIYTGRITNWQQVGGAAAAIVVIKRDSGRGVIELFTHHFALKESEIKAHKSAGDNSVALQEVIDESRAIVFYSLGDAERKAQRGVHVKLLAVDGVSATAKNVRNSNYPIVRQLSLVTRQLPQGLAKQFIDFCLSAQATDIVIEYDFVPYLD